MTAASLESAQHPAVEAWMKVSSTVPAAVPVETLQKRRKGIVYRLVGAGPARSDVVAKWSSTERIRRESLLYEKVLPALGRPGVRYYGTLDDRGAARSWLFVEYARGEQYSPSIPDHRALAGRWLAALHTAPTPSGLRARLPDRGPAYYLRQLRSARNDILRHLHNPALTPGDVELLRATVRQYDVVASRWAEVERICRLTPPGLVHGDFAPKNMRVQRGATGTTLRPFDWASAGWGVPAVDLVQTDLAPSTYWANPDLDVYRSAIARSRPASAAADIGRLAVVGKLLRTLVCAALEAPGLACDWPEAAMGDLRFYKADMDDVLRATGWEE